MAKKRKNLKRKHNQDNHQSDFLADVPESTDPSDWSPSMDIDNSPQMTQEPPKKDSSHQDNIENISQYEAIENINQDELIQENDPSNEVQNEMIQGHTIGPYLKKEREKQQIQLNFIVQSTKISLRNLENLETDNLEGLPNKAYVTGYVKSYSKLLNLDINEALKLLDHTYQQSGNTHDPQGIVIPQAQNAPQVSMPLPWAKIAIAIGGLFLIIAIATLSWSFLTHSAKKQVQTSQIQEEIKTQKQKAPQDITPKSLSAETPLQEELSVATAQIRETQANDDEPIATSPEIKAKPEETVTVKKEEEIKFYPMSTALYQYDNDMSEEQINELLPSRFRVSPTKDILAVFITATKDDSWLTYKSDDDGIRKFVLKKDRSILIRGKLTRLFVGNLGAIKVFLNNRPLKISSPSGVKSIIFPQEMSGDYVTPLFIYKKDGSVITSEEYLQDQKKQKDQKNRKTKKTKAINNS